MRSRSARVDPSDAEVVKWVAGQPRLELERHAGPDQVARAHEQAYRRVHAGWAPATERPIEESLRLFCGEGWLPDSAVLARVGDESSVSGASMVNRSSSRRGLFLIADTSADRRGQPVQWSP